MAFFLLGTIALGNSDVVENGSCNLQLIIQIHKIFSKLIQCNWGQASHYYPVSCCLQQTSQAEQHSHSQHRSTISGSPWPCRTLRSTVWGMPHEYYYGHQFGTCPMSSQHVAAYLPHSLTHTHSPARSLTHTHSFAHSPTLTLSFHPRSHLLALSFAHSLTQVQYSLTRTFRISIQIRNLKFKLKLQNLK